MFEKEKLIELAVTYGVVLAKALLILILGLILIKILVKIVKKSVNRTEPTLGSFISSLLNIGLKITLFITVLSFAGVKMTSLVALLGAAGLAVGLALQGSLSNFAAGILIMFFKPFRIGNFIDMNGVMGTVNEIQIFHTILKTPDNKVIIIPNSQLTSNSVTNFTKEPNRRVDLKFGVHYNSDTDKVREIILGVIKKHDKVLSDPEPFVRLSELADSSLNFTVRVWTNIDNYWDVYFDLIEQVKKAFDANGIVIPYPQRDVYLYQTTK
ncbi:MAG: mechanosensitive ion channel [Candidatus Cloacimonetes bacterium]|nr:mechanosensitive ion channel [Candidatus Cloacimonadota bacterium]